MIVEMTVDRHSKPNLKRDRHTNLLRNRKVPFNGMHRSSESGQSLFQLLTSNKKLIELNKKCLSTENPSIVTLQ